MEGLASDGPTSLYCLRMIGRPVDTAVEPAKAVFFRRHG